MRSFMWLLLMLAKLAPFAAHGDLEEPYHYTQLLQTNLHPGKHIINDASAAAQSAEPPDEALLIETSAAVSAKHDTTTMTGSIACRPMRCRSPYHDVGPLDARNCSDALFDMLVSVSEKLTAEGYDWQLCQGTLLGAVRDRDIIPWSGDVDVCLSEESWLRLQRSALPEGNGLVGSALPAAEEQWLPGYNIGYEPGKMAMRTCENFEDQEPAPLDCFDQSMVYMDIVNIETCPWKQHARMLDIIRGSKRMVEIRGRFFPAPGDAEAELESLYGSDWRTPTLDHGAHGGSGCR